MMLFAKCCTVHIQHVHHSSFTFWIVGLLSEFSQYSAVFTQLNLSVKINQEGTKNGLWWGDNVQSVQKMHIITDPCFIISSSIWPLSAVTSFTAVSETHHYVCLMFHSVKSTFIKHFLMPQWLFTFQRKHDSTIVKEVESDMHLMVKMESIIISEDPKYQCTWIAVLILC